MTAALTERFSTMNWFSFLSKLMPMSAKILQITSKLHYLSTYLLEFICKKLPLKLQIFIYKFEEIRAKYIKIVIDFQNWRVLKHSGIDKWFLTYNLRFIKCCEISLPNFIRSTTVHTIKGLYVVSYNNATVTNIYHPS